MTDSDTTKIISLDDALAGMTLADAILDKSGTRLIAPGVVLNDKSIATLRQRGVNHICIVQVMAEQVRDLVRQQMLQRLDVLFQNSLHSAPNQFLSDCLRRYREEKNDAPID